MTDPEIPSDLRDLFANHNIEYMKSQPVETDRPWLSPQIPSRVYDHICAIRYEFAGQPKINFYHATLIVMIRRELDQAASLAAFRMLWEKEGALLTKSLTSRWLISALDTFADHGKSEERAGAMAITTFFNLLRMADTEYRLTGHLPYNEVELQDNINNYPALWDGLRVFHLPDDDTFANMTKRIRGVLASTPLLMSIFETLLAKASSADTILSRLARYHVRRLL